MQFLRKWLAAIVCYFPTKENSMSYQQLSTVERYQIYSLKKAGLSQIKIAVSLSRDPETISRELRRNKGLRDYRPKQAQQLSDTRRHKARKMSVEVVGKIRQLLNKS